MWHEFTAAEVDTKRAAIPRPSIPSVAIRRKQLADWFRDRRVRLATNTQNEALLRRSRLFSEPAFPQFHRVDGSFGAYGLPVFRELLGAGLEGSWDYLLYTDEDNFIVDWPEVQAAFDAFVSGGFGFAGMPDGGVVSHRFHNPIAINPFMAFFDLRQTRHALHKSEESSDRFGPDLIQHWPASLIKQWDGNLPHRRIRVVVEEGFVPYGTALDDFEPYYSLCRTPPQGLGADVLGCA
ncbi:hypothetical protein ET989_03650 [Propioniciclava sinopodophylli]|uniref:Uncharacterized protein n=1 Tax=Propioniciclava sinopodophylli TaxID=1837344 RepID=A0A4Q9KG72_9ACTN|nr:hypothetical protein [Propioniciclava sinopodophylli]TBT87412.1 hypothetical protein ET989_03650 [Propioniciclava sinopodophylli]